MHKIICTILTVVTVLLFLPSGIMQVSAEEENMTFSFDLTVDGKDTKEVKTGDIITVVLKLRRTDASEAYNMYAMQEEIRYDSAFFELVEGSAVLSSGIESTDIAMVDQHREFYMNYLSMSGGTWWEPDTLIGSFQLKVTGRSGVTKITSQDYLVSLKDGSGSYNSTANDVTIILTTDCTVEFRTNGGSEIPEQIIQYGEKIARPQDPVREGYYLEGWYTDIHLSDKWDFDNDIVQSNMFLYAKWLANAPIGSVPSGDGGVVSYLWCILLILIILLLILFVRRRKAE